VITRRQWLQTVTLAGAGAMLARDAATAQQPGRVADTSKLHPMDQTAARHVRLPPKPGARPSMSQEERDALEHRIRCQCGCSLDVFTCRTTDFSCQVSPAMHRDVLAMVDGGYTAQEILDAFVNAYGDRVLMSPPRVGFNILGYIVPSIALALGAIVLAVILRRWQRRTPAPAATPQGAVLDATPDEMARLDAAIRNDT
jgi:cytochrome c-type biogenesis protein CcmH